MRSRQVFPSRAGVEPDGTTALPLVHANPPRRILVDDVIGYIFRVEATLLGKIGQILFEGAA